MKELGTVATVLGGIVGVYLTIQQFKNLEKQRQPSKPEELRLLRSIDQHLARMEERR